MPRILIAGCGYVGQATADLFHAAGWEVESWTASEKSSVTLCAKPYPIRQVDISNLNQVAECSGAFDTVVHCASSRGGGAESYWHIYLNGARHLLVRLVNILFRNRNTIYSYIAR